MFGVTLLPNSVQEALNRLCEVKKQPQPDEGVRRKLSLLSKQDALYVLEQIHNDRAPIKNTLGAFIVFMIGKLENASSSSSSSPRSVKTASSYQISPSASSSSQGLHSLLGFILPSTSSWNSNVLFYWTNDKMVHLEVINDKNINKCSLIIK